MRILCSQADLSKGLNIVSKAVPVRTTMSILECILIDATTNEIKLTANDMEIGIETIVPGKIEERGIIALDAKDFVNYIRNMPDGEVLIESNDKYQTFLSCEKANFNISGKSGDDYPFIPVIPRNNPIVISQFSLKDIIHQTIFSIGDGESNHLMAGELFEIKGNQLKVVSLDGHRVSIRNVNLKDSYDPIKIIVPGKSLAEIAKILNGSIDDDVTIFVTDNHIIFEFDRTTVVSRLIDGEYFAIDRMLSTDYETKVSVNRMELLDCISRATLMVNETDKKPIIMDIKDQTFEISINSFKGSFNEDLQIAKEGKDIMIAFNPRFFRDALRVIEDERVNLYMVNPKAPCFIRDENNTYIYLILPVNFKA